MNAMTTLTGWEALVVDCTGRGSVAQTVRGHLRLVPDVSASVGPSSVRITRRGRLTVTVLLALACLAGALIGIRSVAAAGESTAAFDTVTVQSGQTLSSIARQAYPSLSSGDGVTRLQLANDLNTDQVFGGEQLRVPR